MCGGAAGIHRRLPFQPRCVLVENSCLDEQLSMQMVGNHQSARCPPRILASGEHDG
jgi:hypothetical protein